MERKNLVTGIVAGAALLGAAYLISKRSRLNFRSITDEAERLIGGIRNRFGSDPMSDGSTGLASAHDGQHLASKIRHKVERMASTGRNI